jgi:aspartyl protease family protein
MKKIVLLYFLIHLCSSNVVLSQELNVEQTLAYINKQLNDKNNKHSKISERKVSVEDIERIYMDDYSYDVRIEHGQLIVSKTFIKNLKPKIAKKYSVPIKDIKYDLSNIYLSYSPPDEYYGYNSKVLFISCKNFESNVTKISIEYSNEGVEPFKKTEKERSFGIAYSNNNLIDEKLKNAFGHLINLASSDSTYNTIDAVADNDPFANPIKKDTVNFNSITITNSNSIPMKKIGGVYEIPVLINGVLKLNFIFDAGASDVSISPDVALTLMRTGTITDKDFLGTETYKFADGSTAKSKVFLIKEIQLGNKKVNNVRASISNSVNAPLLLGQSVLNKFGKVTIDYNKGVIVFQD